MFIDILFRIIFPVFLLIAVGALLDRFFRLDIPTLSKINFYVFVPSLIFLKLIETEMNGTQILGIGGFVFVQLLIVFLLAYAFFSIKRFRKKRTVLSLSCMLNNSGNYGIPFVILAFGAQGVNIMAVVIIVQNILTFTFGSWLFRREADGQKMQWTDFFKVPVLWAVLLGWGFHLLGVVIPQPLRVPLVHLSDGIVPIALMTLGAQLGRSSIFSNFAPVALVSVIKLGIAPLLAFGLLSFFPFPDLTRKILLVASGFPAAVNVFLLASEHGKDSDLASQTVFWTTLLSAISLTTILGITAG